VKENLSSKPAFFTARKDAAFAAELKIQGRLPEAHKCDATLEMA